MTIETRNPKDIADLFMKFGGDPYAYQEFKPLLKANQETHSWRPEAADIKTLPIEPQRIQPTQAAAVQGSPADAELPRELDAFFTRMAGETAAPAVNAHGLLTHWRRQA